MVRTSHEHRERERGGRERGRGGERERERKKDKKEGAKGGSKRKMYFLRDAESKTWHLVKTAHCGTLDHRVEHTLFKQKKKGKCWNVSHLEKAR